MKNLANCKPSEFLRQTSKIRRSVEKWLNVTQIMEIRNVKPVIPEGATAEEKDELYREQARKNIYAALDSISESHPEETLELLALLSFVEPENVDDHPMEEYLALFNDLINNRAVIDFFTSLMRLAEMDI